ncbi:hypothetical protein Tco_0578157 [Tanacetum coccineum]
MYQQVLVDAKEKLMQIVPVLIDCEWSKERMKPMMSLNGSGSSNTVVKKKNTRKGSQQIPMLDSKDLWMDKTPIRGKEHKKMTRRIVETVDLTCGKNDEDWYFAASVCTIVWHPSYPHLVHPFEGIQVITKLKNLNICCDGFKSMDGKLCAYWTTLCK